MFNNISCDNFKKQLTKVIMNCQLPPVVAYYIIKDSLNEIQKICEQVLQYEKNNETEKIKTKEIELISEEDKKVLEEATKLTNTLEADQQES